MFQMDAKPLEEFTGFKAQSIWEDASLLCRPTCTCTCIQLVCRECWISCNTTCLDVICRLDDLHIHWSRMHFTDVVLRNIDCREYVVYDCVYDLLYMIDKVYKLYSIYMYAWYVSKNSTFHFAKESYKKDKTMSLGISLSTKVRPNKQVHKLIWIITKT